MLTIHTALPGVTRCRVCEVSDAPQGREGGREGGEGTCSHCRLRAGGRQEGRCLCRLMCSLAAAAAVGAGPSQFYWHLLPFLPMSSALLFTHRVCSPLHGYCCSCLDKEHLCTPHPSVALLWWLLR
jgi:hypothetical protein